MASETHRLDLETLRNCQARLVIIGKDSRRTLFQARVITLSGRMMLLGLSSIVPEREAPGGCSVEVSFADANGFNTFTSKAVAMSPRGGLWILRPDEVSTLQRRKHFRVRTRTPGHLTVIRSDESVLTFDIQTHDLSAGGLSFDALCALTPEDELGVELELPQDSTIAARARVVRCLPKDDGTCTVGAYFEDLPVSMESRIVRFLNHEQIRSRLRIEATSGPPSYRSPAGKLSG